MSAMEKVFYQVVCSRHDPSVVLADITYDPNQEAEQRYTHEKQRWDRHDRGEETIIDEVTGQPFPRGITPPLYRSSSRGITVIPRPPLFIPQLVEESDGPSDTIEYMFWLSRRAAEGKPLPHNGYVQVAGYQMDAVDHADGSEIRIACELCTRTHGKPLLAFASAETLALVLDRVGSAVTATTMPFLDPDSGKLTDKTVEVRVVPLTKLRKELGSNPRG
ncbi:hypothetical protein NJB1507_45250 [Mycobacterium marinum]|uniref:hypothetical protein n=1 Tax=Mycobacterium marinum TaxID=1781 RepID=UPI0021C399E8|nr:hypothetical protein [Mycobacterium marinum]GJO33428.1 hypothetical protein NJB1507_45250 [Mycobacterium marinum]